MANVSDELQQLRKRARRRLVGAITLVVFALTFLWTVLDGEPPKNLVDNHAVEIISSAPALSSIVGNGSVVQAAASAVVAVQDAPASEAPPVEASKVAAVALPGKLVNHQTEKATVAEKQTALVATAEPVAAVKTSPAKLETPKPEAVKPIPTKKPPEKIILKTPEPKKAAANNPEAILEGKHAAPVAAADKKTYYIQVGAYADAEKAAQLVAKLKSAGVRVSSEKINSSKGELTRVRVGPTEDEAKAKAWIKVMQDVGVSGTLVAKVAQ